MIEEEDGEGGSERSVMRRKKKRRKKKRIFLFFFFCRVQTRIVPIVICVTEFNIRSRNGAVCNRHSKKLGKHGKHPWRRITPAVSRAPSMSLSEERNSLLMAGSATGSEESQVRLARIPPVRPRRSRRTPPGSASSRAPRKRGRSSRLEGRGLGPARRRSISRPEANGDVSRIFPRARG